MLLISISIKAEGQDVYTGKITQLIPSTLSFSITLPSGQLEEEFRARIQEGEQIPIEELHGRYTLEVKKDGKRLEELGISPDYVQSFFQPIAMAVSLLTDRGNKTGVSEGVFTVPFFTDDDPIPPGPELLAYVLSLNTAGEEIEGDLWEKRKKRRKGLPHP